MVQYERYIKKPWFYPWKSHGISISMEKSWFTHGISWVFHGILMKISIRVVICKGSARSRKFFPQKESRQNLCVLREEAKSIHPPDDYKEAAELALYLLGGPETKIWKTCGANHHAR